MQTPKQQQKSREEPLRSRSASTTGTSSSKISRRLDLSLGFSSSPNASSSSQGRNNKNNNVSSPYTSKLTAYTPQRRKEERAKALQEVQAVVSSTAYSETYMDSFHLLGVVTNPRGSGVFNTTSSSIRSNSRHGPPPSPTQHQANSTPRHPNNNSSGGLSDWVNLDTTIHNMTETIDSLNTMFDSISRSYLGNYYLDENTPIEYETELGFEDIPTVQGELPQEIINLDLTSVEQYLKRCGSLAMAFNSREGESERILVGDGELELPNNSESTPIKENNDAEQSEEGENNNESGKDNSVNQDSHVDEDDSTKLVPEIFFSPYFDLTDPKTFESLLVLNNQPDGDETNDEENQENGYNVNNETSESENNNLYFQVPELKPLMKIQKQETLTQHLDMIELALLNQVRSKSDSFFRETNRFTYLKSLVAESVDEVQTLREKLSRLRQQTVVDVEMIPKMDDRRTDLKALALVLDEVRTIIEVKGSVAGLIAANDYIGAVEAIYHARKLLVSEQNQKDNSLLGKLTALSKVNSQLTQYENLVVLDLSNELIQLFLKWGNQSSNSHDFLNSGNLSTNSKNTSTFFLIPQATRQKVKEIISALALCRKLGATADQYKEKLCEIVRVTVRTTVNECAVDAVDLDLMNRKSTAKSRPSSENTNRNFSLLRRNASQGKANNSNEKTSQSKSSITEGVTSMTFSQFTDCLDMIFEQILSLMNSAVGVSKFFREEGIFFGDEDAKANSKLHSKENGGSDFSTTLEREKTKEKDRPVLSTTISTSPISSPAALVAAAELSHKSITELLRLRKEAHSLVSFDEMKRLWDSCLAFTLQLEKYSGQKAYGLRSTLLAQAKAFVERQHESNMASLVAALDGEKWSQCDVSHDRQASLTRLCSGRAVLSTKNSRIAQQSETNQTNNRENMTEAEVEGKHFRVVWSCLLLVEMVMGNVACAAHFQTLATNVVGKVSELLRLFNARSTQLVLGAGAIHSAARLKSINAKHLALVTQCIGLVIAILPHVRAALMAQLPSKQHTLLVDLDRIKKEYVDHNDKIFGKFVSIIGGIVEHGLLPRIYKTDFDARAKSPQKKTNSSTKKAVTECCPFLDGIATNVRKLYLVLSALLPPEDLSDVFSRIFAYIDSKVPSLFSTAAKQPKSNGKNGGVFKFPVTDKGKECMLREVEELAHMLNNLQGVRPWDFGAMKVLQGKLDYKSHEVENQVMTVVVQKNAIELPSSSKKMDVKTNTEVGNGDGRDGAENEEANSQLLDGSEIRNKQVSTGSESTEECEVSQTTKITNTSTESQVSPTTGVTDKER